MGPSQRYSLHSGVVDVFYRTIVADLLQVSHASSFSWASAFWTRKRPLAFVVRRGGGRVRVPQREALNASPVSLYNKSAIGSSLLTSKTLPVNPPDRTERPPQSVRDGESQGSDGPQAMVLVYYDFSYHASHTLWISACVIAQARPSQITLSKYIELRAESTLPITVRLHPRLSIFSRAHFYQAYL